MSSNLVLCACPDLFISASVGFGGPLLAVIDMLSLCFLFRRGFICLFVCFGGFFGGGDSYDVISLYYF